MTERTFLLELPQSDDVHFIDLAQCLSLVNRKMYRQGMQYVVQNIELWNETPQDMDVRLFTLPSTWPVLNGYNAAYKTWQKSQWQVLSEDDEIAGKYRDFKVFYNDEHWTSGTNGSGDANLLPEYFTLADMSGLPGGDFAYDWDYSQIQIPNDGAPGVTSEYEIVAIGNDGATGNFLSAINGYVERRTRPQQAEPNLVTATTSWMIDAFDDGDNLEEIRADLQINNNTPPYPIYDNTGNEAYPYGGSGWGTNGLDEGVKQRPLVTRAGTSLVIADSGPMLVNCGLIRLQRNTTDAGAFLRITLAAGEYAGVMARPMREAN